MYSSFQKSFFCLELTNIKPIQLLLAQNLYDKADLTEQGIPCIHIDTVSLYYNKMINVCSVVWKNTFYNCYKESRFSQDFDAVSSFVLKKRVHMLTRYGGKQPNGLRLSVLSPMEWWRTCRGERWGRNRICRTIPHRRSSTLWFSKAETSMYLQPYLLAKLHPSARNKYKIWLKFYKNIILFGWWLCTLTRNDTTHL